MRTIALVAIGITIFAFAVPQISPTRKGPSPSDLNNPVYLLTGRVEVLEKKILELEKSNKALQEDLKKQGQFIQKIGPMEGSVNILMSEHQRPGGIQGVRRRVYQKNFWDRVPGDAYIVVYQRGG